MKKKSPTSGKRCLMSKFRKIEEHMRMSRALGLAQEVQQSFLPQSNPSLSGFDISDASIYCDETGGD